jgi:hypothetical protein
MDIEGWLGERYRASWTHGKTTCLLYQGSANGNHDMGRVVYYVLRIIAQGHAGFGVQSSQIVT